MSAAYKCGKKSVSQ